MPSIFASLALAGSLAVGPGHAPSPDSGRAALRLRPDAAGVALWAPASRPPPIEARIRMADPAGLAPTPAAAGATTSGGASEPQLIEYSDAYFTRLQIHRWASYLTLPLFVSEYVVGQKLIDGDSSLRGVHGALAGGIGALFVVNTVTGGLNALEAWKDPAGRNRRTLHSALMLLADAGFVATGLLARESEDENGYVSGPTTNNAHRNMALASMGTALIGYSIMLPIFGRD